MKLVNCALKPTRKVRSALGLGTRTTTFVFCVAHAVVSLWAPCVSGQVILVDFSTANAVPTLGGTWNSISGAGNPDLVDTNNSPTGVGIFPSGFGAEAFGDYWAAGDKEWVDRDATGDGLSMFSSTAQIIIQGLDTNKNYRVDLVSSRSFMLPGGHVGDFSINGDFGDSTPNGDDFNTRTDGHAGAVLTWNSLSPVELQPGLFGFSVLVTTTGEIAVKALRLEVLDGGDGGIEDFRVLPNPEFSEQGVTVTWESVAGKTYRLHYKDDLNNSIWTQIPGDVMATGSTASKLDTTAPLDGNRYYLVEFVQ